MNELSLSLEVLNGFEHPQIADELAASLSEMATRLETSPDYSDEDQFFVEAFEGHAFGANTPLGLDWIEQAMSEFTCEFPDLYFALDVREHGELIRREYHHDGHRQTVIPSTYTPECKPEGDWEEI